MKYPVAEPDFGKEEELNTIECFRSNWISSLGAFIVEFEKEFSKKFHRREALTASNGTTALHLALLGLDIGPGDEVIVPSLTFVACVNTVLYTSATPIFADADPEHWNINVADVAKKITKKTKAIMVAHLYGHPADMQALKKLADEHNLPIIEDCSEAHGAKCFGNYIGTYGQLATFSFYGNKIITTGEGGMILLDDPALTKRLKQLRDHNMDPQRRYFHPGIGYNYRMTNIQAAIGVAQLKKLDGFILKKRAIAAWYEENFRKLPKCRELLTPAPKMPWAEPVYWLYSVLLADDKRNNLQTRRHELMAALLKDGIDTRPFFIPLHELPYTDGKSGDCPTASGLSKRGINLPSSTKLVAEDIKVICAAIEKHLS